MVYVLLANGFEETEALTPANLLMRAGFKVLLVSVNGDEYVKGTHGFVVKTDISIDALSLDDTELLLLPGGMPGAENIYNSEKAREIILSLNKRGVKIGAICAAPFILGRLSLLNGKRATVFPGFENELIGAEYTGEPVTVCDNIITARGMGVAFEYGLTLIQVLLGKECAEGVKAKTQAI